MFHGTQFGILIREGKFFVRDFSTLLTNRSTQLKFPFGQTVPIKQGQMISLAACANYHIEHFDG